MVKVREEHPEKADGSVDLERWVQRLPVPDTVSRGTLLRACGVARAADERMKSPPELSWGEGTSCLRTGLEMAEILADPFLAELALYLPKLEPLQRSLLLNHARDRARDAARELSMGKRRTA